MRIRLYVLKKIKKYTAMVKGSVIGLTITSLLVLPISLMSPKFFQILIDEVMWEGKLERFGIVVLGLILVYLLRFICDGLSLVFGNKILNTFTYNIRRDIFEKYKRAPYVFLEKKAVGELKMRIIDDVNSLGNFISDQVVNYFSGILMILFSFCMVFSISKMMTMYCITVIPIVFLVNYLIGIGTRKVNEEIRKVNSEYYTSTHNSLQFWREIKAQNSEKTFIEQFKKYRNILAKLGLRSIRYWAYNEVFNDFKANYLTKVIVYIIGAFFVMKQEISVGMIIMFSEYFSMLFSALDNVNSKHIALRTNEPYYKRIFETFDFPEETNIGKSEFSFNNDITVKNMSFGYIPGKTVLNNINLQINKGDYIAIVGKTGCGKTTLIKILMGLYKIDTGFVQIDGVDADSITKESMYQKIGVVMQDNFLFNMSIRDNLLLTNPKATYDEITEACKKANIYDFIKNLPKGFDTEIGERGVKLSGGQKQRISIAAALLKYPEIIIFDEATSSLDKSSEDIINEAINEISKEVTVIVITHKPATVLRARKVIVMEEGRIAALGTHDELINENMYYKRLVEAAKNDE